MKNASKHLLFCLLLLAAAGNIYAEKKTFTREYTYRASDADSKITAEKIASDEMQKILLREIGTFIISEQQITVQGNEQDYLENIVAITAGIVEMKVLEANFDHYPIYYIKAAMTVDLDDVNRRIDDVLNDKQKTKELEEERKKRREAEAETAKLKRETEKQLKQIANERDAAKRALEEERLKAAYQQQVVNTATTANAAKEQNHEGYRYEMQKDYAEAAVWYRKSAVQGNYAPAQYNLGLLYEFGYGVKRSKEEAKFWYRAAAAQGIFEAGERLKKL
ncbi:hypothetical protein AGMMS4957_02960 [Bacteroidia bacterium]|nr:hypothetical protein AGMMS4957_02960 [Bacteroidia bacterium]